MDELRNAIREKTDQSLDRIVRKTDSPSKRILCLLNFDYLNWNLSTG